MFRSSFIVSLDDTFCHFVLYKLGRTIWKYESRDAYISNVLLKKTVKHQLMDKQHSAQLSDASLTKRGMKNLCINKPKN